MIRSSALIACLVASPAAACDLALALAVDVSASISPSEYALQMGGLADALQHPEVADALVHARAAVMLVQWSGQERQHVSIPWTQVASYDDLTRLAAEVRDAPRAWALYSTAIGEALVFTAAEFSTAPQCARHVIDVSGDGSSNEGRLPQLARVPIIDAGVTINALAIESNVRGLTTYFEENVIGGPNAFVERADNYADYPRAIQLKLLREVVKPAS